jgi:hypothetical protein
MQWVRATELSLYTSHDEVQNGKRIHRGSFGRLKGDDSGALSRVTASLHRIGGVRWIEQKVARCSSYIWSWLYLEYYERDIREWPAAGQEEAG